MRQRRPRPVGLANLAFSAQIEIAATSRLMRADGTAWGHEPAEHGVRRHRDVDFAVLEHVDAVLLNLVVNPAATLAIDTMTRAALEAASQAWWLTDPKIEARARVARLYVLRRRSAAHLEHTARKMGVTLTPGMGSQVKDIDFLYRDQLGLAEDLGPKGGWKGSEKTGIAWLDQSRRLVHDEVDRTPLQVPMPSVAVHRTRSYGDCSTGTHRQLRQTAQKPLSLGQPAISCAPPSPFALTPQYNPPSGRSASWPGCSAGRPPEAGAAAEECNESLSQAGAFRQVSACYCLPATSPAPASPTAMRMANPSATVPLTKYFNQRDVPNFGCS